MSKLSEKLQKLKGKNILSLFFTAYFLLGLSLKKIKQRTVCYFELKKLDLQLFDRKIGTC